MSDETWNPEPERDRLLDFEPVPRKNQVIRGWTAKKQRGFVAALRESGSVRLSTAAVGMGYEGVYKLRHAPGAADFARAWDEAVGIGARRVRDVFIDQNIHGIPERVVIGKDVVVERRRFNHRSMIWVMQHHLPDLYPGGSTTHRRGWGHDQDPGGGRAAPWEKPEPTIEEVRQDILQRIEAIERHEMRAIARDPAKRAAWELLHGPRDWEADRGEADRGEADWGAADEGESAGGKEAPIVARSPPAAGELPACADRARGPDWSCRSPAMLPGAQGRVGMRMFATLAISAGALAIAGAAAAAAGSDALGATLAGASEVPGPADPDGSGSARISFAQGTDNVCFEIVVRDIGPATMAHIHGGAAGAEGGPPVVRLAAPTSGEARGCVAAPQPVVDAIRADPAAYFVNIHNAEFPGGAIRGQLGR